MCSTCSLGRGGKRGAAQERRGYGGSGEVVGGPFALAANATYSLVFSGGIVSLRRTLSGSTTTLASAKSGGGGGGSGGNQGGNGGFGYGNGGHGRLVTNGVGGGGGGQGQNGQNGSYGGGGRGGGGNASGSNGGNGYSYPKPLGSLLTPFAGVAQEANAIRYGGTDYGGPQTWANPLAFNGRLIVRFLNSAP